MPPLTAAQVLEHPEFESVVWDLKAVSKGKATVAQGRRGGPLDLAYEVHGQGPVKLVFIIGLGGFSSAWQRQTKDFGHSPKTNGGQSQKYSVLVFDNRGMGKSDKPIARYTTSELAKDTFELADHVGWADRRQLHVVASSMGGMIAQEMALLAPERIASLTLLSCGPRLFNTVGFIQNLRERINIFIPRGIDGQLTETKQRLFSQKYAAQELMKRKDVEGFTRKGLLLQAIAAWWHHKSAKQIEELGTKVGRERIQVIHGTIDRMITFPHGQLLAAELGGPEKGVTFIPVEGKAHALNMEWRRGLTRAIAALVEKTEALPTR